MLFEWDDEKNKSNLKKHGIRFDEAALIFQGLTLSKIDNRFDYGEIREITLGRLPNLTVLMVTHTDRQGVTRIISARSANRAERKKYDEYYKKITQ